MSNPIGNPGNKGGGRKGYLWEEKNMERMEKLLGEYLTLMEKVVLTKKEKERLQTLQKFVLKIVDKMFANKLAIKDEREKPILIL